MDEHSDDSKVAMRKSVYALLIAVAVSTMIGRIFTVEAGRGDDRVPFLSANDRSRWCTIRSLVDEGTYEIDNIVQRTVDGKKVRDPRWQTIDMVKHKNRDGELRSYSSKPPLLPTLLAGQYWIIKKITGFQIEQQPFYVARVILLISNVLPMLVYLIFLARLIEQQGRTDWGRIFVMTAATIGTFLTAFTVTLNNHLPAAISVFFATYAALAIWYQEKRQLVYFAAAGFFAAFTAANELPALSFLVLLGAALLWKAPRQTLIAFLPAVCLVAAAFFVTNKIAHDSWRPPYMHRSEGDNWYAYHGSHWTNEKKQGIDRGENSRLTYAANTLVGHHGVFSLTPIWTLSLIGSFMLLLRSDRSKRELALLVTILTLVCVAFYIARPLADRNYGGVSCGFRWLFWFTPLWLLMMLPAADAISGSRLWKSVAVGMLAVSVFSAAYGSMNPWSHPWILDYWIYLGWVNF